MDPTDRSQDHIPRVDPRWGFVRIHTHNGYLSIPRRPSPLANRNGSVGPRTGFPRVGKERARADRPD